MSEADQSKTQSLIIDLTAEFRSHRAANEVIIRQLKEMQETHSKEIWGTGDDSPGLKVKVKELTDDKKAEKESRTFWRAAMGVPVIGLVLERALNYLHK